MEEYLRTNASTKSFQHGIIHLKHMEEQVSNKRLKVINIYYLYDRIHMEEHFENQRFQTIRSWFSIWITWKTT